MEGCVTMRVLRKEVPQDVSLQDCLDFLQDIKLSEIEIEKSLEEMPDISHFSRVELCSIFAFQLHYLITRISF